MTTPTISNISGTIATGQTLIITGANMMDEDKTNWDSFFTLHPTAYGFEGTSPADDFYCAIGPCGGIYDTTTKLTSNKSMKYHIEGASTLPPCPASGFLNDYNAIDTINSTDNGEIWIRLYTKYNNIGEYWPDIYMKFFDTQGSPGTRQYYFAPHSVGVGSGNITQLNAGYEDSINGSNHLFPIPIESGGIIANNRWYEIELHLKAGSPNIFQVYFDNLLVYNANPSDGPYTVQYVLMGFINACGTPSYFSLDNWWDGFTVSSSRIYPSSTIEIANSSNYSTATKRYQEPVYLSDGSVQIKADLTDLGTGPYYLFVTNNRQETSLPYSLSSTCPNVECSFQLNII